MNDNLYARWQTLVNPLCQDIASTDKLFAQIRHCYEEPHRAYHGLQHLSHIFQDLDNVHCSEAMAFSVWYHDIIYKPGSSKNEKRSAAMAKKSLTCISASTALIEQCVNMIEATYTHKNPTNNIDTQLFLDADMAILGTDPISYQAYLKKIAFEFKRIPPLLLKSGRKRFIKKTLAEPAIYKSNYFFEKYEQQARINLNLELTDLL